MKKNLGKGKLEKALNVHLKEIYRQMKGIEAADKAITAAFERLKRILKGLGRV